MGICWCARIASAHPSASISTSWRKRLQRDGLALPVLVRFTDILHDRVDALTGAFAEVIAELKYRGAYTAVYPIKVNQQRVVVEEIVRHGGSRVGLEAGSKPELAAVLGLAPAGSVIVCNGYKDRAYIRRALIGQKLGHRVYIVVEKLSELPLVIEESGKLDVTPMIGLRVKLAGSFTSTQQNTGGDKSKFGLACAQVLEACSLLKDAGKLDCVRMVHFHLGSQVANVQDVARGMREAARFYAELRVLGAPVDVVDVGGGLGVDYEGTRSRSYCSMNYSQREYARNIVRTLQEICAETGQPEPSLISESGRALTAHHAVLITSVIERESAPASRPEPPAKDGPAVLRELHGLLAALDTRGPLEILHDAAAGLAAAQTQYTRWVCFPCRSAHTRRRPTSRCAGRWSASSTPTSARTATPSTSCARSWPRSTSAIFRCSSRCRTRGPSTRSSRSCRSIGSIRCRPSGRRCATSPATRMGASTPTSIAKG